MARQRLAGERKLRTREHVLADLSMNFVERRIFLCGFAVNRMSTDYGIDLLMLTNNEEGEVESGQVLIQVKATDALKVSEDGQAIFCRLEVAHLKAWQNEPMPVILVLYDGKADRAYWLYMQQYFNEQGLRPDSMASDQDRANVRIPLKNRLNRQAILRFHQFLNRRVELLKGLSHGP